MSFITASPPTRPPSRPRVRLMWTTSKPPDPRARTRAATLTTTSSPSRISPSSSVGPGGPALPADLDFERISRDDEPRRSFRRPVTLRGRRRRIRSQTSSILSRLRAGTISSEVWTRSVPLESSTQSKPSQRKTLASLPPPIATRRGSRPAPAALARPAPARPRPSAPCSRETAPRFGRRRRSRAHSPPGAGIGDLPRRPPPALGVEAPRLGVDRAVAGDHVSRRTAGIRPTFAVVPSSSRPSPSVRSPPPPRRSRCPRPRGDPGVRLDPDEVGEDLLLGRGRDDHLADRAGMVQHEAHVRAQLRAIERLCPPHPCSSATVRTSSIPTGEGRSTCRAISSMKTATAALLSAPRIVLPRLR